MKDQLLDTWATHQRMNRLVIDNTTDAGMQKTLSSRGGRNIYQQWVHIHNVRMKWLEVCATDIFKKYRLIDKDSGFNRKEILKSLEESAAGIHELLDKSWDAGGRVKGFSTTAKGNSGVIHLLGYFISHESHHRGNILLTLKQVGEKIPDALKWGLWEW